MSPRKKKDICDEVEDVVNFDQEKLPPVTEWLPTGCTILDFAASNRFPGGLPVGRIIHVYGASSTCKSLFAYTIMGYAQRAGWDTYYDDVENSMNPEFADMCGVDLSHSGFHLGCSPTLEEFFDEFLGGAVKSGSGNNKLVVVDSITNLPAAIEKETDMDAATMGMYRAKQIHLGLRKWNRPMAESKVTLLCIDQTRKKIGGFGGETTSGGTGLEFLSTIRIHLTHRSKVTNSKKMAVGTWVDCEVTKTRFGPPFRGGLFKLDYSYGLDDISTNLGLLAFCQSGEIKESMKKTAKVTFMDETMTVKSWIKKIEEEDLEDKLKEAVWEAWQDLYKAPERKPRKW